jgi:hypothetical protein
MSVRDFFAQTPQIRVKQPIFALLIAAPYAKIKAR